MPLKSNFNHHVFFSFCLKFLSSIDVFLPIFSLCKYFGLEHNCKMCIWCSLIGTVHIVTTTSPYVFNCITFIMSWPLYPALRYGLWSLLMSYSDLYLRRLVYCRKLSCWQSNYIFLSLYCLYFRRLFFFARTVKVYCLPLCCKILLHLLSFLRC